MTASLPQVRYNREDVRRMLVEYQQRFALGARPPKREERIGSQRQRSDEAPWVMTATSEADPSVQGLRVVDSDGREHAFAVATCAVGASLRRIRQDWHGKYPHLPDILAVVSWADQEHHEGTIYRAANFSEVGTSGGSLHGNTHRRNGGHDQLNPDYLHLKTAFIYEFRRSLSSAEKAKAELAWRAARPGTNRENSAGFYSLIENCTGRLTYEALIA